MVLEEEAFIEEPPNTYKDQICNSSISFALSSSVSLSLSLSLFVPLPVSVGTSTPALTLAAHNANNDRIFHLLDRNRLVDGKSTSRWTVGMYSLK
jgi:hypothetical protein